MDPNNNQQPQPFGQPPQNNNGQATPSNIPPVPQPPITPQQFNNQPMYSQPVAQAVPVPSGMGIQGKDPGKTLAIISLILALFASFIGLILALVANKKSKKAGFSNNLAKVSIILNSVIFVLGIGIILLFFVLMYPGVKARAVSMGFSDAVRAGNYDKALTYISTDGSSSDQLKLYFASLKNSIGSSQTEVEVGSKDGKRSFIYTIQGGESKYYRVIVESSKVSNTTVSNEKMGLFPGSTAVEATNTTTQATATPIGCVPLVNTDFTPLLASAGTISGMKTYEDVAFFNADSTVYTYPVTTDNYAKIVAFHKSTTKPYKIELSGSVYKDYNTQAGKTLAQQRTEKVKSDLVAAGIPASIITIVGPTEYPYGQKTNIDASVFRNVNIKISTTCI